MIVKHIYVFKLNYHAITKFESEYVRRKQTALQV